MNIVAMLDSSVLRHATIVIDSGRILSINGSVPANARRIDGRGKWIIPGLIDMHVHTPVDGHFNTRYPTRAAAIFTSSQDVMTPYVANGVTTIFELGARGGHFGQRNEILRGDVIGPRMALAAIINGNDARTATTPAEGRQSVRMAKAEGYEFVKVYSQLSAETYLAIVDEAAAQGMKVVGHIPNAFRGHIADAFAPGFGLIAHAEELAKQSESFSDADAARFAELARANGTWLCPTLTVIEWAASQARSLNELSTLPSLKYVHPLLQSKWLTANSANRNTSPERVAGHERTIAFNKKLVQAFKAARVPIVAGTDAGITAIVWGFSLHDELRLLTEAGLTPYEALESATRLPAQWLGIDSLTGTVEVGKFADLVLLNADPLTDIRNTKKIAGVFVNGRWIDQKEINRMLAGLAQRNESKKHRFDWSKRAGY